MLTLVACLSTIPSRIGLIDPCLKSLLRDSGYAKVFLTLPRITRAGERFSPVEIKALEERFSRYIGGKLVILWEDEDHGPLNRVVGPLRTVDGKFFLVALDETVSYNKSTSRVFRRGFTQNAAAGYSMDGWIRGSFPFRYRSTRHERSTTVVDCLSGKGGIGFQARLIDWSNLISFQPNDVYDVRISGYLARAGVPRVSLPSVIDSYISPIKALSHDPSPGIGSGRRFWDRGRAALERLHESGLTRTLSAGGVSVEGPLVAGGVGLLVFITLILFTRRNAAVLTVAATAVLLYAGFVTSRVNLL